MQKGQCSYCVASVIYSHARRHRHAMCAFLFCVVIIALLFVVVWCLGDAFAIKARITLIRVSTGGLFFSKSLKL